MLPRSIQDAIHNHDSNNSTTDYRAISKAVNRETPTECWMTVNFPLGVVDLTEDELPRRSECSMCRQRRRSGEGTACFFFKTKNSISLFVFDGDYDDNGLYD